MVTVSFKTNECLSPKKTDSSPAETKEIATVGGHSENFSQKDGFVVKKTNQTEGQFYQRVMSNKYGLTNFMPNCTDVKFDFRTRGQKSEVESSVVTLEDLRTGFVKPVIYDIKLGIKTVSVAELKSAGVKEADVLRKDVKAKLVDGASSSVSRGYRFVASSTSKESRSHNGTHPDDMLADMMRHIAPEDLHVVVGELEKLHAYLGTEEGRRFEMISASLLIVAESDPETMVKDMAQPPRVKIIDFAHSNIVGPKGVLLSNGVFASSSRRKTYQKGFRRGVENLANDLSEKLNGKPASIPSTWFW